MTEQPETHTTHAEDALDQLEEEIEHLEHVSRWGRWLGWGAAIVAVVAIVGAVLWTVLGPPPTTSARMAYVPAGSTSIDVSEPRGAANLGAPPSRFAWESVTGRFQYRVRVYVRDTSVPVVEKFVTTPFVELTAEEQARITGGKNYVWTVVAQGRDGSTLGAGQSSFRVR